MFHLLAMSVNADNAESTAIEKEAVVHSAAGIGLVFPVLLPNATANMPLIALLTQSAHAAVPTVWYMLISAQQNHIADSKRTL